MNLHRAASFYRKTNKGGESAVHNEKKGKRTIDWQVDYWPLSKEFGGGWRSQKKRGKAREPSNEKRVEK